MKAISSLAAVLPLVAASPLIIDTIHHNAAPVLSSTNAQEIPDSYIVVFKKHVSHESAAAHHNWIQDVHTSSESYRSELRKRDQFSFQNTIYEGLKHTYNITGGLLGYSGHFDNDVIEQVRRHPDVSVSKADATFPPVHIFGDKLSYNSLASSEKNHLAEEQCVLMPLFGHFTTTPNHAKAHMCILTG